MISNNELIIVQCKRTHYKAIVLVSMPPIIKYFPALESQICFLHLTQEIFSSLQYYGALLWKNTIECSLCKPWVHADKEKECTKYYEDMGTTSLGINAIFYFPACIDTLASDTQNATIF